MTSTEPAKFQMTLAALGACEEARQWVGERTLKQAWNECPRGDWLLWLAAQLDVDRRLIVEAACRCAEAAIGFVPEGEDRPIRAIETARAWIRGEATLEDVRVAAYDAYDDAANAAYKAAAAAAYAAYAATYAAYNAAAAADAAADAAYAADAYAARTEARQAGADLVRQVITLKDLEKA